MLSLSSSQVLRIIVRLKAVESIQATGGIAEQERNMLIKTILNDNRIENILVKQG